MATYQPPTLAELRTVIARSLRDVNGDVFTDPDLNDFIYEGLADLGGYRPIEIYEHYDWDGTRWEPFTNDLVHIWHIEVLVPDNVNEHYMIPYNEQGRLYRNGWEFYAGEIRLSAYWAHLVGNLFDAGREPTLLIWGYRNPFQPSGEDDEVLDIATITDELCVRMYAKMAGFNRLNHDRGLYQQWLAATNNTDVSPTQIQGMLAQADDAYTRQRRRSTILRRAPANDFSYID